jgi:hypothetical protein
MYFFLYNYIFAASLIPTIMRLSILARKLEISPSDLLSFYNSYNIGTYTSHNNKVEEDHQQLAVKHFRHSQSNQSKLMTPKETVDVSSIREVGDYTLDNHNVSPAQDEEQTKGEEILPDKHKEPKEIEFIRMPKIKLQGVKVVGKIDLHESVKDDSATTQKDKINVETEEKQRAKPQKPKPSSIRSEKTNTRPRSLKKRGHKVLSYKEKLEREEYNRKKEQQRRKKLIKEQRKQHYLKNVQAKIDQPKTNIKSKARKKEQTETVNIHKRPVHKNPLHRLWAWLNGEYDRY